MKSPTEITPSPPSPPIRMIRSFLVMPCIYNSSVTHYWGKPVIHRVLLTIVMNVSDCTEKSCTGSASFWRKGGEILVGPLFWRVIVFSAAGRLTACTKISTLTSTHIHATFWAFPPDCSDSRFLIACNALPSISGERFLPGSAHGRPLPDVPHTASQFPALCPAEPGCLRLS